MLCPSGQNFVRDFGLGVTRPRCDPRFKTEETRRFNLILAGLMWLLEKSSNKTGDIEFLISLRIFVACSHMAKAGLTTYVVLVKFESEWIILFSILHSLILFCRNVLTG